MKLDLPVMIAALVSLAAVQEALPALPAGQAAMKVQLLPAVAFYYSHSRPWQLAVFAAAWAGILTDALGGLPHGATSFPLLALALAALVFRGGPARAGFWAAFARMLAWMALLLLAQHARAAMASLAEFSLERCALRWLQTAPPAALASAAFARFLWKVELLAGNVDLERTGGTR